MIRCVKTKIEQENAEEGAVGGINNIAAIKLDAGEYAKAEESALSLDSITQFLLSFQGNFYLIHLSSHQ
jgi:hypothetical protein